jgi:hypothetical protein
MGFRPVNLKMLPAVFLAATMVLSAGAQQSAQPVIFSSAQSDDNTPSTLSLAPQATEQPNLADKFRAPLPASNLNFPSDAGPLPQMPANPPADNERLQQILEERRNWTLMTPQEIFGVTTPEEIMGLPKHNAAGEEIKTTQVERWLARQEQSRNSATNGLQNGAAASSRDFSSDEEGNRFEPDGTKQENPRQFLDSFMNPAPDNNRSSSDRQNEMADWPQSFGAATQPKIDPEQQAAMERFRQLLEPNPSATAQSDLNGKNFTVPVTTENSILGQPSVNPLGASFTPLTSDVGKPLGLPGITRQNNSQPAPVPSWEPQPAPWLSQVPQPFVVPQRKF